MTEIKKTPPAVDGPIPYEFGITLSDTEKEMALRYTRIGKKGDEYSAWIEALGADVCLGRWPNDRVAHAQCLFAAKTLASVLETEARIKTVQRIDKMIFKQEDGTEPPCS